jgi:hypothetical protein
MAHGKCANACLNRPAYVVFVYEALCCRSKELSRALAEHLGTRSSRVTDSKEWIEDDGGFGAVVQNMSDEGHLIHQKFRHFFRTHLLPLYLKIAQFRQGLLVP